MKTFYAVFDTNVLVSALMSKHADSLTVLLLDYVLDGRIVLLYNEDIINEYKDVLHRDKFHFNDEQIDALLDLIRTGLYFDPTASQETFADEDDRVFYEVALSKEEGYVVTGNTKHFPKSPIVVTPAEMMQIIQENYK